MRPISVCLALLLAALVVGCGQYRPEAPDSFTTTDTMLFDSALFERRRDFEEAIVGHRLRGDGVDVTVAPGGVLVGTENGTPFSGAWVFRGGEFCYALADRVTRSNRQCFRAAMVGRTVHLVPVED